MPLADVLHVSLNELLNGERLEKKDIQQSISEIVMYSNEEKQRKTQQLNLLFAYGCFFIIISILNLQFHLLSEIIPNNHIEQGLTGALFGLGMGFEVVAFYLNNHS